MRHRLTLLSTLLFLGAASAAAAASYELLNVSYDPTRELYRAINTAFSQQYKVRTGSDGTISQSHRGNLNDAHPANDSLPAEQVTLVLCCVPDHTAEVGPQSHDW